MATFCQESLICLGFRALYYRSLFRIMSNENAITISKSVHWFVETKPQSQSFVARIVPYLEAYPRENNHHSLERFIEATAEEAIRKETLYSHEDLRFYLRLVTACQGSGSVGSGALILAVTGSGNLKFAELTSMTQLRLQVPAYIREIEREIERIREPEHQLVQERAIEPDFSVSLLGEPTTQRNRMRPMKVFEI